MCRKIFLILFVLTSLLALLSCSSSDKKSETITLLNVSYDPTREFYQELNAEFIRYWKEQTGRNVVINQSHGGSGKQARSVIDGLEADVLTLALAYDIEAVSKSGLIATGWQQRLSHNSAPYFSTIVFLVRRGNPKNIRDWDDLTRPDVQVITPNPKTSGGARWNYLAAWAYALEKWRGSESYTRSFVARIFENVPVLDTGARGATTTFVERGMGDVFISWENEALLVTRKLRPGEFELVVPSLSILAEPPVTIVDSYARKHNTYEPANAYLNYLYSGKGQELAARHFYRPRDPEVARAFEHQFPQVRLITIDTQFGGWEAAQSKHFTDGGVFDEIYLRR